MAAITFPRTDELGGDAALVGGARARAAAVRARGGADPRSPRPSRPSLFAGSGQLRRPALPVRLTSVRLVAHDDLASVRPSPPQRIARPVGSVPTAQPAARPSAAVYRRRRAVAAAVLLGALLLVGSWVLGALGSGSLAASEGTAPAAARESVELEVQPVSRTTYVVAPGDTLWSIARALRPEGDVRPVVDALAATRQGRPLQVGETIVLP